RDECLAQVAVLKTMWSIALCLDLSDDPVDYFFSDQEWEFRNCRLHDHLDLTDFRRYSKVTMKYQPHSHSGSLYATYLPDYEGHCDHPWNYDAAEYELNDPDA